VCGIDRQIVQEQVLDILPLVSEVNAISEELNKYQTFDVVLMTVAGHDGSTTKGTKLVLYDNVIGPTPTVVVCLSEIRSKLIRYKDFYS